MNRRWTTLSTGHDAAKKRPQAERVERDHLAGHLSAATYERLRERLADELAAAQAEQSP